MKGSNRLIKPTSLALIFLTFTFASATFAGSSDQRANKLKEATDHFKRVGESGPDHLMPGLLLAGGLVLLIGAAILVWRLKSPNS